MLESEEGDAQLARDAIDLETSLKDAEASPVVTRSCHVSGGQ